MQPEQRQAYDETMARASAATDSDDLSGALALYIEATNLGRAMGSEMLVANASLDRAIVRAMMGEVDQALQTLEEVIATAERAEAPLLVLEARAARASMLARRGQIREGIEELEAVLPEVVHHVQAHRRFVEEAPEAMREQMAQVPDDTEQLMAHVQAELDAMHKALGTGEEA
ncbi:MAG: hypothetical protein KTR31_21595 [Myxococcales bacterium]|nr:hypothetical protein [Myxococcales bacterium]